MIFAWNATCWSQKHRNVHRTAVHPEITHLGNVEMPRCSLSCSVQFGCKSWQELAPRAVVRLFGGKCCDPSEEPPYSPSEGIEVGPADEEWATFEEFLDTRSVEGSFWAQYKQYRQDPGQHP
jgi:hypothetical protein